MLSYPSSSVSGGQSPDWLQPVSMTFSSWYLITETWLAAAQLGHGPGLVLSETQISSVHRKQGRLLGADSLETAVPTEPHPCKDR